MHKYITLILLLMLPAVAMQADSKKRRNHVATPDTIPVPVQSERLSREPLDLAAIDSLIEDSVIEGFEDARIARLSAGTYNSSTVAMSDTSTWRGRVQWQLDSLCHSGIFETTQLGLYVRDLTDGTDLWTVNHRHRMRPASCQKLVTAISALHTLGGNYQFRTTLCTDGDISADSVLHGNIYIIGGMDPVLAQGDVYQMVMALQRAGIDSIAGRIYTDTGIREDKDLGWGWCWDDKWGPLRALTVDGKDRFVDELRSDLQQLGIRMLDWSHQQTRCPSNTHTIYVATHTIDQVLQRMMKNSHNIYAESLFYQLAAKSGVRGAGHKQAATYINQLIKSLGLTPSRYQIADGSGLSLYNYVTPELLVRLLEYAWNTERIRTHLYPSLPIAGEDGTLSKRMRGTAAQGNVHAKTGTVEGISSLSGYATATNGHVLAFSIINQSIIYTSTGKDFQDKVCRVLCSTPDPAMKIPDEEEEN